jgi:phosphoenolpyruvate carboxylase
MSDSDTPARPNPRPNEQLRNEIRELGHMLGQTLQEHDGPERFALEEEVRALSKARRRGDPKAEAELIRLLGSIGYDECWSVARAFSIFFDLANLAEDRHRVRVLRERQQACSVRPESLGAAVEHLKDLGVEPEQVQELLMGLRLEPVFTAHPTEAKRRAIRSSLRRMRGILSKLDRAPSGHQKTLKDGLHEELDVMWQTDLLRMRRPTVLEEVSRGLFFIGTLWRVIPALHKELRQALAHHYPGHQFVIPPFVRFGSWMGGDRDGNPNVTANVTAETLRKLRRSALHRHLHQAQRTFHRLTQSEVRVAASPALKDRLQEACWQWPQMERLLQPIPSDEVHRRWLRQIRWRLKQSLRQLDWGGAGEQGQSANPGAYFDHHGLLDDLALLQQSLGPKSHSSIDEWIVLTQTFGFFLTSLDVRQEAEVYQRVIDELLGSSSERTQQLIDSFEQGPPSKESAGLSAASAEALALFRLLGWTSRRYGTQGLGCHILSMTHSASDIVALLWLQKHFANGVEMPLVPLFETIGDLQRGPAILAELFGLPVYREYLARQNNEQVVMVGYSDSTKDGGYLAANWALYSSQMAMHEVADKAGVKLIYFHGRGGSLGRGGGPAARSILSLPPETVRSGMRLTEQGEVLSERYDDPHVAQRHLEQLTWAMFEVRGRQNKWARPPQEWLDHLEQLAKAALGAYRELVEQPGFVTFFQQATPIEGIEQLQIGSRPSRRPTSEPTLKGLRAIPWVFSWTQNRLIIPAWYGLGAAVEQDAQPEKLRHYYQEWPFFRAIIDNAALALAKADLGIGRHYAQLVTSEELRERIWSRLESEHRRSEQAVLQTIGQTNLLQDVPWLQRSIAVRNPYVDPLNLIQLEVFRRLREAQAQDDQPQVHAYVTLLRMTIQGVAGGLRTTG